MKSIIILIFFSLTIQQCFAQGSENLKVDESAQMIFTPTELKGIEEMIHFVDGLVSDSTNIADINQAYHAYFDNYKSYIEAGTFLPALLKDSIKFEYLEAIDKNAFEAIWRMDDYVKIVRVRDTTLTDLHGFKTLELNLQGKYLHYIKEIGKSDNRYADFFTLIEIAGDLNPGIYSWFPTHHLEFDFTSFKDRLWATVFLLRLGDPIEEKVERYLNGKTY